MLIQLEIPHFVRDDIAIILLIGEEVAIRKKV